MARTPKHMKYKAPTVKLMLVHEPCKAPTVTIRTPCDLDEVLSPLKYEPNEKFVVCFLNPRNEIIGVHEVSHGTLSTSLVHPREVFKAAVLANAYAIICAHNHPSGNTTPSPEDVAVTKELIAAGKLLHINIVDHIIIAQNSWPHSIRESHASLWGE